PAHPLPSPHARPGRVGHRVLRRLETYPSFVSAQKAKAHRQIALAMGFSVPVLLNSQVSSSPAPVWAHVQQQEQHWHRISRERFICSLNDSEATALTSTLLTAFW